METYKAQEANMVKDLMAAKAARMEEEAKSTSFKVHSTLLSNLLSNLLSPCSRLRFPYFTTTVRTLLPFPLLPSFHSLLTSFPAFSQAEHDTLRKELESCKARESTLARQVTDMGASILVL